MRDAETALKELDKVLTIQTADGNWNYDAYMHGMANGMIMARSCITGEDPDFIEAPKEWLADRPMSDAPVEATGDGGERRLIPAPAREDSPEGDGT